MRTRINTVQLTSRSRVALTLRLSGVGCVELRSNSSGHEFQRMKRIERLKPFAAIRRAQACRLSLIRFVQIGLIRVQQVGAVFCATANHF